MDPLARILPHLDFYVPNETEAAHQTGRERAAGDDRGVSRRGRKGLLGIKLGERGALLSPRPGEFVDVAVVKAPGQVVDTTGAGDCFYRGTHWPACCVACRRPRRGRWPPPAGACCVTGLGAHFGRSRL